MPASQVEKGKRDTLNLRIKPELRGMIDRAAMIAINSSLNAHKILCDVVIEPHGLGSYGIFDTDAADEIYAIGYEEGLKTIAGNEMIKALLAS